MSQGTQEDGGWEVVVRPFVERVIGGIKLYFGLLHPWMVVVEIDLMHGGAVSGSLWKMQPVRSNVALLEMCSCSFLLSLLAWQPRRAGEQGINHVAIICTGLNKGCGSFELPNSNSEFPTREGNNWVVVAQTHILWGPAFPWQILHLFWPILLVFCMVRDCMSCGNCMCCNDPLFGVFFLWILWNSKARLQWRLSCCFKCLLSNYSYRDNISLFSSKAVILVRLFYHYCIFVNTFRRPRLALTFKQGFFYATTKG